MADKAGIITIEVRTRPGLRFASEMCSLIVDALDLVPEWHELDKARIKGEALRLMKLVTDHLKQE